VRQLRPGAAFLCGLSSSDPFTTSRPSPRVALSVLFHSFARSMEVRGGESKKGVARIRLQNGNIRLAELHWYEAHGIGKKELKFKRYLD
jgi:hypothetical protein